MISTLKRSTNPLRRRRETPERTETLFPEADAAMSSDALVSPCGTYRYWLTRTWDKTKPVLVVAMVNPSKADHRVNDPTILWLIAFAKRRGYGGLHVVNMNALRSSDPGELLKAADPVGPENDYHIAFALGIADTVLVAWGNNGAIGGRDKVFLASAARAGVKLICLGTTKDGHPKHPLARGKHRIPADFEPVPFPAPALALGLSGHRPVGEGK